MKKVTMRKEGGNDRASWAVRVNGRLVANGLERREAVWVKGREEKKP